jgi:histidinol-phosphate phosphatase family protein
VTDPGLTTVFLDRDGVINVKSPVGEYVESWAGFSFLPGAVEAVARLRAAGLRVVVVTNQRGVALGRMSAEDVEDIHARMIEAGVVVDRVYYCPHGKKGDGPLSCSSTPQRLAPAGGGRQWAKRVSAGGWGLHAGGLRLELLSDLRGVGSPRVIKLQLKGVRFHGRSFRNLGPPHIGEVP